MARFRKENSQTRDGDQEPRRAAHFRGAGPGAAESARTRVERPAGAVHAPSAGQQPTTRPAGKRFRQPGAPAAPHAAAARPAPAQPQSPAPAQQRANAARPAASHPAQPGVPQGSRVTPPTRVYQPGGSYASHGAAGAAGASRGRAAGAGQMGAAGASRGQQVASPYAAASGGRGGRPPRGGRRPAAGNGGGTGRQPRRKNILPKVLIAVGVVLLLVAGGLFAWTQFGYQQAVSSYNNLTQYVVTDTDDGIPDVDFDALAEVNPDVVGWIYVPNTTVSYPVVQTDNNDKYLNMLFDGTSNASGAIFMDMDNAAPGGTDQQTTLYGHHMMNDTMFNFVDRAHGDQVEFDKIERIYYITRETTYIYTPVMDTRVSPDDVDVRTANLGDGFTAYLERLLADTGSRSDDAEERIASADRVLTLVTCNYDIGTKQRSAMVCVLDQEVERSQG